MPFIGIAWLRPMEQSCRTPLQDEPAAVARASAQQRLDALCLDLARDLARQAAAEWFAAFSAPTTMKPPAKSARKPASVALDVE